MVSFFAKVKIISFWPKTMDYNYGNYLMHSSAGIIILIAGAAEDVCMW